MFRWTYLLLLLLASLPLHAQELAANGATAIATGAGSGSGDIGVLLALINVGGIPGAIVASALLLSRIKIPPIPITITGPVTMKITGHPKCPASVDNLEG